MLKSFLATDEFDGIEPKTIFEAVQLGVTVEQLDGVSPYDFL
jgi:hypothetical protein